MKNNICNDFWESLYSRQIHNNSIEIGYVTIALDMNCLNKIIQEGSNTTKQVVCYVETKLWTPKGPEVASQDGVILILINLIPHQFPWISVPYISLACTRSFVMYHNECNRVGTWKNLSSMHEELKVPVFTKREPHSFRLNKNTAGKRFAPSKTFSSSTPCLSITVSEYHY